MKDRELLIRILVHAHLRFDEVAAVPLRRDLQGLAAVGDAVVGAYRAGLLDAQDLLEIDAHERHEGVAGFRRRESLSLILCL